ncbi:MAG: hypothetical protein U5K76_00010 [Woeseiaceae bacterium]|nr:hypothetical protein [Woeseiaceae bacterium]
MPARGGQPQLLACANPVAAAEPVERHECRYASLVGCRDLRQRIAARDGVIEIGQLLVVPVIVIEAADQRGQRRLPRPAGTRNS